MVSGHYLLVSVLLHYWSLLVTQTRDGLVLWLAALLLLLNRS